MTSDEFYLGSGWSDICLVSVSIVTSFVYRYRYAFVYGVTDRMDGGESRTDAHRSFVPFA